MDFEYRKVRNSFKQALKVFRLNLLIYKLLKGGIIVGCSFLLLLFIYYFSSVFFQISVLIKTVCYYLFLSVIAVEILFFLVFPILNYFFSLVVTNDILFRQILHYLPFQSDLFESVYHLSFHKGRIIGNEQLKKAAFIQKFNYLKEHKLYVRFPARLLLRNILYFVVVLFVFLLCSGSLSETYGDLKNYEVIHPKHELNFSVLNDNLNVEYGKGLKLKLKIGTNPFNIEHVFICFGGGEFLMSKEDSLFVYDFEVVNNDISFHFKALDQQSDFYKITVLPAPVITGYKVTSIPPAYTGLKPEVLVNTVDFRVVYGSVLKFEFDYADLDSLSLEKNGKYTPLSLKTSSSIDMVLNVLESGEYGLYGSNRYFKNKDLLHFSVTCIPDLYPGIQVSELVDSLHNSVRYFYGVITDDYGFSALRFNYSINGGGNVVVPIVIVNNKNTQEFYFSFDFAEFAGMDKSKIDYYFEIFDNDRISGPKSTRSDQKVYQVPDLNSIFDYNLEVNNTVNTALQEVEKLAAGIVSGVKELQKKMLDNNVDNWEKQQLSKDIVQKKEKLDKLLQAVKENNLKKSDLNKSFTGQDSVLISKQKQIQDLLDKVMDDEMKKLMDEFSKLSDEFSKEKFHNLDEKMKLTFDQMSEELDRNIELLKRFQIEERHDLISKQLDKLKADQQKFGDLSDNHKISKDSLSSLGDNLQKSLENLKKNYEELLKNNAGLTEPYALNDFKPDFNRLSEDIEKQSAGSKNGKTDKKLSEKIEEEIQKLSEKMEEQQKQNFVNNSLPENNIELIIQNILIISLSEEELLKQFPKVEPQSLRYNELGQIQDLKRQQYKIVKDSLSVLAKSNLMLASLLSHKFYDIEVKFGLLPGYIQDNRRGELAKEQQYIINYLNDMALSLTDALQKDRQSSKNSGDDGQKKGSGSGKSGENNGEKYGQMKKFQNSLKKQLENLISQMKKGEKGKPLQQGISNIIRENELFKKSLNDFISESGSMTNTEKQLLNEINRLLDDNIKDLANYSVSTQLISRNNLVYNKLLMSEKASKEREEFEEKRKSRSAEEEKYQRPQTMFNTKRKSSSIKVDLQKSDLKLNDYFETMYNNYFIKLGNE